MEATGVYWKPVWHVLEAHCTLVLANAMHIRIVPGRKSDMNDATWIADLLAHGLIRSSALAELRDRLRASVALATIWRELNQLDLTVKKNVWSAPDLQAARVDE